jgi:pimeloyl-ACP methyl ester carboxylesterase
MALETQYNPTIMSHTAPVDPGFVPASLLSSADSLPDFSWIESHPAEDSGLPPIVFFHGLLGDAENWRGVADIAGEKTSCYAIDIPMLRFQKQWATIGGMTEYARMFLEQLGLKKAILVGNSLGGHMALKMSLIHPERCAGLIITGSSGLYEKPFAGKFIGVTRDFTRGFLNQIFFHSRHVTDEMVERAYGYFKDRRMARNTISLARDANKDYLGDQLQQIEIPVQLIWGREDSVTPPEVAEEFLEKLPNAELYWLQACAHAPQIEYPREFAALTLRYLEREFALNERAPAEAETDELWQPNSMGVLNDTSLYGGVSL